MPKTARKTLKTFHNTNASETERKLKESEEKYRVIFESSGDAIMTLTDSGFVDCNKTTLKIFGFNEKKDFLGKHPSEVSPPKQPNGQDSMKMANNQIAKAIKEGKAFFEWMHRRADGTDFLANVLLTPVIINGQKLIQATVRDISENKKTEELFKEKIEEVEKMNRLMVGRELKMIELKERIKQLEASFFTKTSPLKSWPERFQEGIDLEEVVLSKLKDTYFSEIKKSGLSRQGKKQAISLVKILVDDSQKHENWLKDLKNNKK